MKITVEVDVEIVDELSNNSLARIHYPDEGNKILITKGMNAIEVSRAIHHEIGHFLDWYLGNEDDSKIFREENAERIGESIRFKESNTSVWDGDALLHQQLPASIHENNDPVAAQKFFDEFNAAIKESFEVKNDLP